MYKMERRKVSRKREDVHIEKDKGEKMVKVKQGTHLREISKWKCVQSPHLYNT